jgi:hypothetical protein
MQRERLGILMIYIRKNWCKTFVGTAARSVPGYGRFDDAYWSAGLRNAAIKT